MTLRYNSQCVCETSWIPKGTAYCNFGDAFRVDGKCEKAIGYLNKGLAIAEKMGNQRIVGGMHGRLGSVFGRLGQYKRVIGHQTKCLSIARELGDRDMEVSACLSLGFSFQEGDQLSKAMDCYRKSISIARELGDGTLEGASLKHLGAICGRLGQHDKGNRTSSPASKSSKSSARGIERV